MSDDCAYCGDEAEGEDHLVPVSRQTTRRRSGKMASVSETVPACALCNSLLGASPAFTVRDRAAVLLLRYAERPRSEAIDTARKLRRLFQVVAGFDLGDNLEAIDERNRRRFAEDMRERQRRDDDRLTEAERMKFEIAAHDLRAAQTPRSRRSKLRAERSDRLKAWFKSP